jgi:hypothetical protein
MGLAVCIVLVAASAARGAGPVVGWGAGTPTPTISAAIAVGGFHTLAIALPKPEHVTSLLAGCLLLGVLAKQRAARARGLTSN